MITILISLLSILVGGIIGSIVVWNYLDKVIEHRTGELEKNRELFKLTRMWITAYQEGKKIENYLINNNIENIAIYGMGAMGITLYKEFEKSKIKVVYGIDRSIHQMNNIDLYLPEDDLPNVDAIIVTAIMNYNDIERMLSKKVHCKVLSIADILLEV